MIAGRGSPIAFCRAMGTRREESPDSTGRALGNTQAERSDTGATENIPPMADGGDVHGTHCTRVVRLR